MMINNSKEYILCAAVKRLNPKTGISYTNNDICNIEIGYRHHDIYQRFPKELIYEMDAQGFYTSKGRFVDRKEAMKIAYECGQIKNKIFVFVNPNNENEGYIPLFSEDLY